MIENMCKYNNYQIIKHAHYMNSLAHDNYPFFLLARKTFLKYEGVPGVPQPLTKRTN